MNRHVARVVASLRAPLGALALAVALLPIGLPTVDAEPATGITLTISKTHDAPMPVASGQSFTFTLAYGWSGGAPGTLVVTDALPPEFDVISTLPSSSIVGNVVTFTLTGLVASGGAGTLQINARFKPGVTCNGTSACNEASILVGGDPASTVKSNSICLTASAQNRWTFAKYLVAGCALDDDVIFQLCVMQPSGGDVGGLNLTSVVLGDVVPAGAVVTSVTGQWPTFSQSGTNLTLSGGPTSLPVSAWSVAYCEFVRIKFPSPTFAVGQTVTNSATLTFRTPCDDGTPQQLTDGADVTLCAASPSGALGKGLSINTAFPVGNPIYAPTFSPGCCATYAVSYTNTGNVPQPAPFDLVDDVPQELDVTVIRTNVPAFSAVQVDVYTWNGAGPCTLHAGPGFPISYAAGAGLQQTVGALPANICRVVWRYAAPLPLLGTVRGTLDVCVRAHGFKPPFAPVLAGQSVVNTLTAPNNQPNSISVTHTKPVDAFSPRILAAKFFIGAWGPNCQVLAAGPFVPGNTVRWRMAVANVGNLAATPCTLTDVLPAHLTYAGNPTYVFGPVNWMASTWNPACNTMTAAIPAAIGGTITTPNVGDAQLVWTFPTLPSRCDGTVEYFVLEFDVLIGNAPPAPPGNYPNSFSFSAGNLATTVTSNVATLTVNGTAQLTLFKEVRALPGGTFAPQIAVAAGAAAEFRLRVTNTGNLPLANVCLLDVLPHVGDVLVLSGTPTYPVRGSTFNLPTSGTISASLAGFVGGYNTAANAKNPNRTATCLGFCGTPDPANGAGLLTNGTFMPGSAATFSFSVDGGTTALAPGATLEVLVPVTVPTGTGAGALACNNFGLRAVPVGTTTCLVTQSNVACVSVTRPVTPPGLLCIQKFDDANGNGQWDAAAPANELGLGGFTFVVTNSSGFVTSLTTLPSGLVCHSGPDLPPGGYTVSELAQAGWTPTTSPTQTTTVIAGERTTVQFGNRRCGTTTPESGRLCVFKFLDENRSGKQEPGEPPLEGWTFQIRDAAGNVVATLTTDGKGSACLPLPVGNYAVVETPQPGYAATTPATQSAVVVPGQVTNVVFGNRKSEGGQGSGKLCVFKFLDENRNRRQDSGEPPLQGWTFQVRDPAGNVVATLTTDESGSACTGLPTGPYTVAEIPQVGYAPTTPATVPIVVVAGQLTNLSFGNRKSEGEPPKAGKLCIHKFEDVNGNRIADRGEPGLAGWRFTVSLPNGQQQSVVTGPDGVICFSAPAGTYTVVETPQRGWTATTPPAQVVTVTAGESTTVSFGNRKGR